MTRHAAPPTGGTIERLFDLSVDMLGTASFDGYFTRLNLAGRRTLGRTNRELMAWPALSFVHPDDLLETTAWAAEVRRPGSTPIEGFENRICRGDGTYRWIRWNVSADEGVLYFVGRDVTERRVADDDRDQAASLMTAIIESVADGVYVVAPDGRLTFINPAGIQLLGYETADELLGRSPHAAFHYSRWDGSPYAIEDCPLVEVRTNSHAVQVPEEAFWRKDGSALPVSYSSAPIDLTDGTGSVVAFRDITALHAERERVRREFGDIGWFEEVRQALAKDRFVLYGQPIIDLATGATTKDELLLRMLSPTGQVIDPGLFLPAAEKYGFISGIDRWVITQAVEMAASGRNVALNLSAGSVGNAEILSHIERELTRTGAAPDRLTFEVTETAVMNDLEDGRRFADHLVAIGCSFALDDFGTGYGSLTYLRQLPIAYLKIDVQFVREMARSEADRSLVKTIVSIAQGLDKETVAEGVEDEQTADLLREFGVDFAQGFYFGRPRPSAT